MTFSYNPMPDSPYKGPKPYSEEDVLFFFGRENSTERIINSLMGSPLTLLYGASGVGKTSVLQASVAHSLRQEAKRNLEKYGKPEFAVVVFNSWKNNLLKSLIDQVEFDVKRLYEGKKLDSILPLPKLKGARLDEVLEAWTKKIGDTESSGQLLIILDQFEDYFLSHSREEQEKDAFAVEFPRTVNRSDLPVNFLVSMREDSLYQLDQFKESILNLFSNRLELKQLSWKEDGHSAIVKPIDEYNRQQIIINHLMDSRLTVLYGEENIGKSFVLESGVAHRLRLLAKDNWGDSGKPNWAVAFFRNWQGDPIANLLEQVGTEIENLYHDKGKKIEPVPQSSDLEKGLKAWLERIDDDGKLLIILDQFEQYFDLDSLIRKEFADKLASVVARSDLPVNFLLSIRQDSLEKLSLLTECICKFEQKQQISELLNLDKYLYFQPLEEFHLSSCKKTVDITDELVEKIMTEVRTSSVKKISSVTGIGGINPDSDQGIETPYLQLAMTYLWREVISQRKDGGETASLSLGIDTWDKLGGIGEIAKKHLEELMGSESLGERSLTEDEKKVAADVFRYLVSPVGTKIAYPVRDLANEKELKIDPKILDSMLKKLTGDERILKGPFFNKKGHECYEIFHDMLAQPILQWRQSFILEQKSTQLKGLLLLQYGKEYIVSKLTEATFKLRNQDPIRQDELMALLARQAYLFNQKYSAGMIDDVDEALRQTMNRAYFSTILYGHGDEVSSVTFSPDSQLFASGSYDGAVKLWDLEQKKCINTISSGLNYRGVLSIAISPDGKKLAAGCGDSLVRIFNLNQSTTNQIILKGHTDEVWSVAFSPDSKLLASGSWDKTVRLWDLDQQPEKAEICRKYHRDYIWSVAFNPNGNTLAAGCRNGTIWLRSLNHSKKLKLIKILSVNERNSPQLKRDKLIDEDEIFSVAFNDNGTMLAAGSGDGKVRLWDLNQLDKPPTIMPGWEDMERSVVAFSFDGQWLASGSDNGIVKLWKVEDVTNKPLVIQKLKSFKAHYKGISSVAFSQDGKWLGSSSWDWTTRLWALQPSKIEPIVLEKHQEQITTIAFSQDSQKLASGSFDQTLLIWDDLDTPNSLPTHTPLNIEDGNVNAVAFSFDGQWLASGLANHQIQLWDLDSLDNTPKILEGHGGEISALAFSPHNPNILASGSWDNTVRIWDLSNSKDPKILKKHKSRIRSVVFSPNDNILATSSEDRTVRLWNLNQPDTASIVLLPFDHTITSLTFSKTIDLDNYGYAQLLAISTDDNKIQVWDVTLFQKHPEAEPIFLSEYSSSEDQLIKGSPVVFSPDGYILASGSHDNKVRLWDLHHPRVKPVALEGHRDKITSLAFSPDGKWIAAGSLDKTIYLWLVKTETIADLVCDKVWRNLTFEEWATYVGNDIPYQCTCSNLPQGKGVLPGERGDILQREFDYKISKLMDKQKKLLSLITDKNQDLSEEDIFKQLQKTKLERADLIGLESLCRLGFLSKKSSPEWGTIPSYSLSDRYHQYRLLQKKS